MGSSFRAITAVADAIGRRLVWLLIGAYCLAAIAPGPGAALRELRTPELPFGLAPARFSLWMVAVMLFSGAVSLDIRKLGDLARRPVAMLLGLLGVWGPPLVMVAIGSAAAAAFSPGEASAGVLLGVALAAAMPVANSAVGWTQQSRGNLAWALGLVVLSISVCPWVAPALLRLMGLTLSAGDAERVDGVVARFGGATFVAWVLAPTLLGFATRAAVGAKRVALARPPLLLATATALVLLNYANASIALPAVVADPDWPLLAATVAASALLPLLGMVTAWALAPFARLTRRSRYAWSYALSMKNTGLALALADTALGEARTAVLVILVTTLTQHAVAGAAHAIRQPKPRNADRPRR